MKWSTNWCHVCGKRIERKQPVAEVKVGRARNIGWIRALFGLINPAFEGGKTIIHVDCIEDVEYDDDYPELTAGVIEEKLGEKKTDD